jgi:hypothetical protein
MGMEKKAIIWLKVGFIAGAVVDALALLPMLIPRAAKIFWGFSAFTGMYYFAQGMGASLMLGWTLLLLWAYRKPLERRFVALLTDIVVIGIVMTEIFGIIRGYIDVAELIPSLVMQPLLLILFGYGFILSGKALKEVPAG